MSQAAVYGIFGWPVTHSRSPAMHNAAFRALGIAGVYVAFPVAPEQLGQAVAGVRALGIAGLNITLPHKTAVMAHLDAVDPAARAIGAVNTIVRDGERLLGENTDAPGLRRSLEEAGVALADRQLTVLGAGGAARAAVVGLGQAGAARITVAARRRAAAEQLCSELRTTVPDTRLEVVDMDALADAFAHTDVLVQATSATLGDTTAARAFADALPLSALPAHAVATDLVYKPKTTSVLGACQARGLATVDGTGMLLHQGALAFERWTGSPAPTAVMRDAFFSE